LRQIALNLLKSEQSFKGSINTKRLKAVINYNFLLWPISKARIDTSHEITLITSVYIVVRLSEIWYNF